MKAAENDVLTRTGPGTPMGNLFRRFWQPVLLSRELPEPDCPPVRVKMMDESLLAFRDTNGRVGLVEPRCPHRGADLFYGRNEQCGLRCAYHGFKFDTEGRCVDIPIVPKGDKQERMKAEVSIKAYPIHEAGDVIWAFMGPRDRMSAPPMFEFGLVPATNRWVSKKLQECNWAQTVEGAIDTAHFTFLHAAVDEAATMEIMAQSEAGGSGDSRRVEWMLNDGIPRYSIKPSDGGLILGGARRADDGKSYWRIAQFLMPSTTFNPSTLAGDTYHGQTRVPVTDENMPD